MLDYFQCFDEPFESYFDFRIFFSIFQVGYPGYQGYQIPSQISVRGYPSHQMVTLVLKLKLFHNSLFHIEISLIILVL